MNKRQTIFKEELKVKKEIKIQQENIKKLIKLVNENPDLKIIPMVDTEVCSSDDFSCWAGNWDKAEIDECYCSDERIYFRSYDEDSLLDGYIDNLSDEPEYKETSDEDIAKIAEEKVNNLPWEKVITIWINAI